VVDAIRQLENIITIALYQKELRFWRGRACHGGVVAVLSRIVRDSLVKKMLNEQRLEVKELQKTPRRRGLRQGDGECKGPGVGHFAGL
jgi:hypothetical protein